MGSIRFWAVLVHVIVRVTVTVWVRGRVRFRNRAVIAGLCSYMSYSWSEANSGSG